MSARGEPAQAGPLKGVRVLEMGSLIAGPFCGQLLGDLGAEVIKVEPPDGGDPMRQWGHVRRNGRSYWWAVIARNKKSVTLNLREPEGQDIARKLAAESDVLIENFRPGTLERWGLGWETLHALNPRLVMVRVSGYGQDGPYARRASFGAIGEAMGGLRHLAGEPGRPPVRIGISIGDALAATFAALGALAALRARDATGRGQIVDSALYESVLAMTESMVAEYAGEGYQRERSGATLPGVAPSNVYPCADGTDILIAANQDTVFRRLTTLMERPDLAADPRFGSHEARGAHQAEIDAIVAGWTRTLAADEALSRLDEAGVPAGRIYTAADMLADPHFAARKAIIETDTPGLGAVKMQNVVPRLSETPGSVRTPGPELGEHNQGVYRGLLGLPADVLERLRSGGVI